MNTVKAKYLPPQMEVICLEAEQCLLVQSGLTEGIFEDSEDFSDFFE